MNGIVALVLAAAWASGADEARCQRAVRELDAAAETIEALGDRSLQMARAAAADALILTQPPSEADQALVFPWLEAVRAKVSRACSAHEAAEGVRLASARVSGACKSLALSVGPTPGADRALMRAILSRPEYNLRSSDDGYLAKLLEKVARWLRDVFAEAKVVQHAAISLRTAFLAAAVLGLVFVAWRVSRSRSTRKGAPFRASLHAVELDDPARYQASADDALRAADGREAIRSGLLALLATLERARLATPRRAATNREVAHQISLRGGPDSLAGSVARLVEWYDRTWYGLAAVTEAEARQFVTQARALCVEAARWRSAGPA